MPAPGRGRVEARAADVERDDGVGLDHRLHDGVPVRPVPQRGQPDLVGPLGEGDRREAALGVAADLGRGERGVGQVGDPERHDALGVRRVPLLEEPVVPGPDAGEAEVAVLRVEEDAAAEARDHGREVHRGPHAVDVHVAHPGLDVVAAGTHLVEAERLQAVRLGAPSGHRVHAHLGVALALELPDLVTLLRLDDARGPVGQGGGHAPLEHVGRLDHVVVDRDHGVAHLPGLGLGEEQIVVAHSPEYARGRAARRGTATPRVRGRPDAGQGRVTARVTAGRADTLRS